MVRNSLRGGRSPAHTCSSLDGCRAGPDGAQEEAEEFVDDAYAAEELVRPRHLATVFEVIAFEMAGSALENMGVVIAGNLAEYLAEAGDGLIRDQNDDWWAMRKTGSPLARRPRTAMMDCLDRHPNVFFSTPGCEL